MFYELYLPYPPSVNSYYVQKSGFGKFISAKGRRYRDQVAEAVVEQLPGVHVDGPMLIDTIWWPPDKRTRDEDNLKKALLDAITHTGLWEDDSLIHQHFTYKGVMLKGGLILMRIQDAGPLIPIGGKPPE